MDVNLAFEALIRSKKYDKLKFIDLIHYMTALLNNCDEIISFDTDFNGLEIKRVS
ncbi:PIN domain-containing protein [Candidatus Pacearchaeota archaeon]|nr:PIN domain-containing protein [Candidatus Pacearchaeota archaeon]